MTTRLPDRLEQLLDLLRRRRPRVHLVAVPLRRRVGDLRELLARDTEVAETPELAEARELLDARRGVAGADRLAEANDGLRDGERVEAQRGREAERVHRPVGEAVAPSERLSHRVREA